MVQKYDHARIEKKWQAIWEERRIFETEADLKKPKFYILDMFPYPSGAGLHVGHVTGYTATDILARYKRQKGFNVLHPMGWDSFGLPAEQYAMRTGTHPAGTTEKNIATYRRQLKSFPQAMLSCLRLEEQALMNFATSKTAGRHIKNG